MTATQIKIQSQVIDLSTEAFKAFFEDISGMFGVRMKCAQQQICTETIEGLKKHFQGFAAVSLIRAKGALNGTFQLILDKQGLFILGNLMIMPERMASLIEKYTGSQKIENNIKNGSLKEAEELSDAIAEAGNIMVGSWDRVFREGLERHAHFTLSNTFIGNPWEKPEKDVGLAPDEELLFSLHKVTAGAYPAFTCCAVFPKAVFHEADIRAEVREKALAEVEEKAKAEAEQEPRETEDEIKARIEAEETAKIKDEMKAKEEAKKEAEAKSEPESETESEAKSEPEAEAQAKPEESSEAEEKAEPQPPEAEAESEPEVKTDSESEAKSEPEPEKTQPQEQSVSKAIAKMTESAPVLPGEDIHVSVDICAKDFMQTTVVWGSPEDSVQDALTKMQQHDTGYMMVGKDNVPEGILSKSDLTGAISPYLRPVFAKWRRSLDDATLQIKIKWIMSRPVTTIKPETPITSVMENMRQLGKRAMPVMDDQGKILGLVTVFDLFNALLKDTSATSSIGKVPEAPPLA